ncbi:MAG: DUF1905 domain-containing protein [Phycisphaerales bacterium]|nr:DUF1905 domain-containing protein [Phycisphaerales bacterium]MCB9862451.1 DUF1905 domain-containing protein [Phycisphaerales bacterium]
MAVNANRTGNAVDAGRRFAIGANVALSIVVATALLIAINWIASLKHWRKDLATVGNYGLSDRTRTILDGAKDEIALSIVYEPNDKDKNQREYINRLQAYCDELAGEKKNLKVTHVATDRQREQLVADMSGSVGGEAKGHKEAIESFERLRTELEAELSQRVAEAVAIQSNRDAWLSGFPLFAQVVLKLQEMRDQIVDIKGEIDELTPQGGLPKYGEAATVAKTAVDNLATGFSQIASLMNKFTSLSQETTRADSQYIATLREVTASAQGVAKKLRAAIGDEDAETPADIKAPLKAFADACVEVAGTLDGLVSRVDRFADAFPIVRQHADWSARIQSGPLPIQIEVGGVLQETGRSLEKMRLQVLGILDKNDPAELKAALVGVRKNTTSVEQNIAVCEEILTSLADNLSKMDPDSEALLAAAGGGGLFSTSLDSLESTKKQLAALPELTLGDIADKLREPNTIVVQYKGKIRVITFDETWPIRQGAANADDGEPIRTFNGDSAIGSAILALSADKKFANVVFVGYEPPAPQQRSPFSPPPPRSSIPLAQTNLLRERLLAANYNVVQWNLAEQPDPPTLEGDLKTINVFLPPAPPAMPNPFGPQTPQASFGEPERQKVRDMLAENGRAIFLAGWELMGSPMGGPPVTPEYGYNPILQSEFGLHVDNGTRVIKVVPDTKTEHGFSLSLQLIQWLPTIGYSDNPIGKSMKGTRSLVSAACVIDTLNPEDNADVETESVLRIPDREEYFGASTDELMKIFGVLNDPRAENVIQLENRPKTTIDAVASANRSGTIGLPLGFVPPMDAAAARLTINGYTFRSPIVADESQWIEIPESVLTDAGVSVGPVEIEISLPGSNAPKSKTIQTTIERKPAYRLPIPRQTIDEMRGFVRESEYPVHVTIGKYAFDTIVRTSDDESWIPLTDSERSAAGLEAGKTTDVAMRIIGINENYYPQRRFNSTVGKVESPKLRAQLAVDPSAGSRLPRLEIDAKIKGHDFKAVPFTIGGDYRVPLYKHDLKSAEINVGDKVRADVELIVAEEPSPFDLVVCATRKAPADAATKPAEGPELPMDQPKDTSVVVMSIGQSYLDAFLTQPYVADFNKIRLDPPPTENLDLFVNAVHWLNGTTEYIGRGPVPVPRINAIKSSDQTKIRALLFGIWPALVLAPGIVLWFLRRR